eukprot:1180941-Prorocentrum_minimum.AAC.2
MRKHFKIRIYDQMRMITARHPLDLALPALLRYITSETAVEGLPPGIKDLSNLIHRSDSTSSAWLLHRHRASLTRGVRYVTSAPTHQHTGAELEQA